MKVFPFLFFPTFFLTNFAHNIGFLCLFWDICFLWIYDLRVIIRMRDPKHFWCYRRWWRYHHHASCMHAFIHCVWLWSLCRNWRVGQKIHDDTCAIACARMCWWIDMDLRETNEVASFDVFWGHFPNVHIVWLCCVNNQGFKKRSRSCKSFHDFDRYKGRDIDCGVN